MEYDNDRPVQTASRVEIVYWFLLVLVSPVTASISHFLNDGRMWAALLLISIATLPAYLLYSRIAGPLLFTRKRYAFFVLVTILFFLVIFVFLFVCYGLVGRFQLLETEARYFAYSTGTIIREAAWIIIKMAWAVAIFFLKRAIEEKDELHYAQQDNAYLRLRYLRAQLSPHFLFNTLNSIYSLSLQNSPKTPEVVIKLADIMRYLVYECNEDRIPLDKEIEFIRNYVDIEKTRHNADVRFVVEGDTSDIMIEPFLFISFIENGFKHAMDDAFTEPFIYITLKVLGTQLVLNVINSTGADVETQTKRINGKGISSSKSLLELLYPDAYALDIIQTEKEESRRNALRVRHARERLENLYPDAYTLDVILSKNAFTVSLIIKRQVA